jgi:hypothetical protein
MENEVEVKKSGTWTTNYCNVSIKHLTNKLFFNTEPSEKKGSGSSSMSCEYAKLAYRPSSALG